MRLYRGLLSIGALSLSLEASKVHDIKDLEVQFLPVGEVGHPAHGGKDNVHVPPKGHPDHPHGRHPDHHAHSPHARPGYHPPVPRHAENHAPHGSLPLAHFMRMFPMDLPGAHVKVIHIDANTPPDQIPGMIGDSLLESILSELGPHFHTDMKPLLAASHAASRGYAPHLCTKDIERFCNDDHHGHEHLSPLHCLGLHESELSGPCSAQISHSIPVVCANEISLFCHHELDKSVLQCLEEAQFTNESCSESVFATRRILSKMKTQNFALVNKRTGEIIRSTMSVVSTSIHFAFYAFLLVGVAVVLYALWSRDDETSFVKALQRTFRELKMKSKKMKQTTSMEMKSNYSI